MKHNLIKVSKKKSQWFVGYIKQYKIKQYNFKELKHIMKCVSTKKCKERWNITHTTTCNHGRCISVLHLVLSQYTVVKLFCFYHLMSIPTHYGHTDVCIKHINFLIKKTNHHCPHCLPLCWEWDTTSFSSESERKEQLSMDENQGSLQNRHDISPWLQKTTSNLSIGRETPGSGNSIQQSMEEQESQLATGTVL